jgi:hypothetical protein
MPDISSGKTDAGLDETTVLEVKEALKIDGSIFENSLRLAELVALWEHRPAVESAGGLTFFCADQLGASATQTSKRLTVGKYIVLNVGAGAVLETGIKAFEVVYQAAREVEAGESVFDALEKYALTPTRAALDKAREKPDKPNLTPLQTACKDKHVEDLMNRGLTRAITLGFTPVQTLERLAVVLLESTPENLRQLLEASEVVA